MKSGGFILKDLKAAADFDYIESLKQGRDGNVKRGKQSHLVLCGEAKHALFHALSDHVGGGFCGFYADHKTHAGDRFDALCTLKGVENQLAFFFDFRQQLVVDSRDNVDRSGAADGFPPKVEPWSPKPKTFDTFSESSVAPMGSPPPSPFAVVTMSGVMPKFI